MPQNKLSVSLTLDSHAVTEALRNILVMVEPASVNAILEDAGRRIGRIVTLQYPSPTGDPLRKRYTWANGRRSKFKSHHHQRAFFALLKSGKIRVPYRRTGRLARALEFSTTVQPTGVELHISLDERQAKYARFVVGGKAEQASYFRRQTQWKPLRILLANQREEMAQALAIALKTALQEAGL